MATIDLNYIAQRAKAAGKNPEQFVQECFEEVPHQSRTPIGGTGPTHLPPPVFTVPQRFGGLPQLGRPAGAPGVLAAVSHPEDAEACELLLQLFRLAIRERHDDRLIHKSLEQQSAVVKGNLAASLEEVRYTQERALQELMAALLNVYAISVAPALELVLRKSQALFQWQQGVVGAMREQMARFVYLLGVVTMRVSSISAQKISDILGWVALRVECILTVLIPVIICILSYGLSGTIPVRVITSAISAAAATIRSAIVTALSAGVSITLILHSGLEVMGVRILDWAERTCEAWLLSRVGTPLTDLVRELHRTLGLAADWIAERILHPAIGGALTVGVSDLMNALALEYGRDAKLLAHALKAARVWIRDIAIALKNAGFSALETGRALKDEFGLNRDQITTELRSIGFFAEDVMRAVLELFKEHVNRETNVISVITG